MANSSLASLLAFVMLTFIPSLASAQTGWEIWKPKGAEVRAIVKSADRSSVLEVRCRPGAKGEYIFIVLGKPWLTSAMAQTVSRYSLDIYDGEKRVSSSALGAHNHERFMIGWSDKLSQGQALLNILRKANRSVVVLLGNKKGFSFKKEFSAKGATRAIDTVLSTC